MKLFTRRISPMHKIAHEVARALLEAGVIGISETPVTFKSGLLSPVYIDNRRLPFHPQHWRTVIVCIQRIIEAQATSFDVIAGVETAGIPHSAALAYTIRRPFVFVRKQPKDHGTQQRIEGGAVRDKRVLLLEDQVTTGASSLSAVAALSEAGAVVEDCMTITSYGFTPAVEAFTEAGVRLHTLTNFQVILEEAESMKTFGAAHLQTLRAWLGDPRGWSERHKPTD
jgi:orotate phosphoribosyltransferase